MTLLQHELTDFKVNAFQNNEFHEVTKADVLGHWSLFFFYPADFTFVCPTELEDLARNYAKFKEIGCEVYSVSCDTHFVHKAWHDANEKIAKIISEEKETTLRLSDQIRKRAAFEIAKVTRDQVPLAAAESGLKTLKLFQQIVDGAYGISSRVLGIERIDEKSSEIPTLRIEEMTDADVEEIREIQRKQMQELIEGDLDGMLTDEEVEVDESLSGSEGVVARPDTANEDEDMS